MAVWTAIAIVTGVVGVIHIGVRVAHAVAEERLKILEAQHRRLVAQQRARAEKRRKAWMEGMN